MMECEFPTAWTHVAMTRPVSCAIWSDESFPPSLQRLEYRVSIRGSESVPGSSIHGSFHVHTQKNYRISGHSACSQQVLFLFPIVLHELQEMSSDHVRPDLYLKRNQKKSWDVSIFCEINSLSHQIKLLIYSISKSVSYKLLHIMANLIISQTEAVPSILRPHRTGWEKLLQECICTEKISFYPNNPFHFSLTWIRKGLRVPLYFLGRIIITRLILKGEPLRSLKCLS